MEIRHSFSPKILLHVRGRGRLQVIFSKRNEGKLCYFPLDVEDTWNFHRFVNGRLRRPATRTMIPLVSNSTCVASTELPESLSYSPQAAVRASLLAQYRFRPVFTPTIYISSAGPFERNFHVFQTHVSKGEFAWPKKNFSCP